MFYLYAAEIANSEDAIVATGRLMAAVAMVPFTAPLLTLGYKNVVAPRVPAVWHWIVSDVVTLTPINAFQLTPSFMSIPLSRNEDFPQERSSRPRRAANESRYRRATLSDGLEQIGLLR